MENQTKFFLVKRNLCCINGKSACEVDLMGESSLEMLKKRFFDAQIVDDGDWLKRHDDEATTAVMVYADFPSVSMDNIRDAVLFLERNGLKSVVFQCGFILKGKSDLDGAQFFEMDCGAGLTSAETYPTVLGQVRQSILKDLLKKGVIVDSFDNIYVDSTVEIEPSAHIFPFNNIRGASKIGKGAILHSYNDIEDSCIGENAVSTSSTLRKAVLGKNSTLGPNSYLRPNTDVGQDCRIGNFVELKNSKIGNGTKIAHLTYVGDAEIGENVNIGCGVVFVNYDGKNKFKSFVGNDCFVGSNCNLVAPVKIGNRAFVAAGTTVTKDVPESALCIGRTKAENKAGLAEKYLKRHN